MVNKLYNIFFILFLISFLSCMEKKGKDKHPEIPEFPITTNKNISIRAIISAYDDLYYNDSVIVYKKNDTVNIYNVLSNAKVKMLSNVLTYANGFFIIQKDKEYKAIDDKKFTDYSIKIVDENKEYNRIQDSIIKLKNKLSEYENNTIIDSLFVDAFYKKHQLDPKLIPISYYIDGSKDSYVKTETDEFIIINTPYSLDNALHPTISKKKMTKINLINNFQKLDHNSYNSKNIFKNYDYAMMRRFWTSGNTRARIISFPSIVETGYYYFDFNINNQKGNFKILSDNDNFIDLTKIQNNSFLTSYNYSIYEVSFKK